jgi:hypothetical protein
VRHRAEGLRVKNDGKAGGRSDAFGSELDVALKCWPRVASTGSSRVS